MQTKKALSFLSQTLQVHPPERESPLDKVADRLLAENEEREATRMDEATTRAAIAGRGALIGVMQDHMRRLRGDQFVDQDVPAMTNFDAYTAVKDATYDRPHDRGLKTASYRLYKRWTDEIAGSVSLRDLTRIAEQGVQEYPKTTLGDVLEAAVTKSGFHTLRNVQSLARIAGQIKSQEDYEAAVLANGLDHPGAFQARAFIQALVSQEEKIASRPTMQTVVTRTLARIGAGDDVALNEMMSDDMDEGMAPHDEMSEESTSIASPISGEMLTLELAVEDTGMAPNDVEPAGSVAPQLGSEKVEKMEMLGQLEEMMPSFPADDMMDGPSDASISTIMDPSSGQELEVTIKPVDKPEEDMTQDVNEDMPPIEAATEHCAEHNCASRECADLHKTAMKQFYVYATIDGKTASIPIDQCQAHSMRDIFARLAGFGVKGKVLYSASDNEAAIVLDEEKGDYLHIVADLPVPKINQQQPDSVSVPTDGATALKTMTEFKQLRPKRKVKSSDEAKILCHWLGLDANTVEAHILDGDKVIKNGWQIQINSEDLVEFGPEGLKGRMGSMVQMDDIISDFQAAVANELPEVDEEFGIVTTAMFEAKCASCNGVSEYLMPEEAISLHCGHCDQLIGIDSVVAKFAAKDDFSGYHFEVQIPRGQDLRDFEINGKRVLAEVSKVAKADDVSSDPITQKISFAVRDVDAAGLARIERVMRGVFGIVEAQISPLDKLAPAAKDPAVQGILGQQINPTELSQADQPTAQNLNPLDKSKMAQMTGEEPLMGGDMAPPPMDSGMPSLDEPMAGEGPMAQPMDPSLGGEMPIEDNGMGPMFTPGAAPVDEIGEEAMHAAVLHYRNQGLGVLEALAEFKREYSDYLEQFGDEASPERHLAEAEVVRVAGEIYAKPALVQRAALMVQNAMMIFADVYSPKVNTQQPNKVAPQKIGPDSEKDDKLKEPGSVPTQHAPHGTGKLPDTNLGSDQGSGHKGPSPKKPTPQGGSQHHQPGTSHMDTDLGRDTAADPKKKFDSLSKNAPNTVRSK